MDPDDDLLPLGAVPLPARSVRAASRLWTSRPTTTRYLGTIERRERDAALRQHGLRAADARRRAGERRGDGAQARRADAADDRRRLRAVDRPRRDRRLAARHGLGVRDARGRRRSTRSRWRSARSCSRTARSTPTRGWGKPQRTRVHLRTASPATVTKVLEQNMLYGTGVGAYFGRPAAGKTGTTDNYADAWFCGYTPNLEATVWVGYPRGRDPDDERARHRRLRAGPSRRRSGSSFMESAIGSSPALDFPEPKHDAAVCKPWQQAVRRSTYDYADRRRHDRYRRRATPPRRPPSTADDAADSARHDDRRRRRRRLRPPPAPPPPPPTPTAPPSRPAAALRGRPRRGRRVLRSSASASRVAWPHRLAARPAARRPPTGGDTLGVDLLRLRVGGVRALPRRALAARAPGRRGSSSSPCSRAAIQLAPLGAPLLLSTDAWTYWDYGRHRGGARREPVRRRRRAPSRAIRPSRTSAPAGGDTTSVYGPAFTLASEPVALAAGSSADAAAWIYKVLAALAVLAVDGARGARSPAARRSRARSSAGTRCSRCTSRAAATTTRGWRRSCSRRSCSRRAGRLQAAGRRLGGGDLRQVGAAALPAAARARGAGDRPPRRRTSASRITAVVVARLATLALRHRLARLPRPARAEREPRDALRDPAPAGGARDPARGRGRR